MYTFAKRPPAQRRAAHGDDTDIGGSDTARSSARVTPAGQGQSLDHLAHELNTGPRAAAQAELVQLMSGAGLPVFSGMDGQGLTDEEELVQSKSVAQRQALPDEDDELLQSKSVTQRQTLPDEDEEPVLRKAVQPSENLTGLPDGLKAGVEQLSGQSLDSVRVHFNSPKPAQLQALAYTQGTNIHVAPGQEQHLPHEAWHVTQQMQGRVQPTGDIAGTPLNDDTGLEREADTMGERAARL